MNKSVRLIPRDVKTRWNSTYDMLIVAKEYSAVIDKVTAQRDLKLRAYELSSEEWKIVDDLIYVLKVIIGCISIFQSSLIFFGRRCTKMLQSSSQATRKAASRT